jgi:hypothetical protein
MAGATPAISKCLTRDGHEFPIIPARAERQFENAMGRIIPHAAGGQGIGERIELYRLAGTGLARQ